MGSVEIDLSQFYKSKADRSIKKTTPVNLGKVQPSCLEFPGSSDILEKYASLPSRPLQLRSRRMAAVQELLDKSAVASGRIQPSLRRIAELKAQSKESKKW